MYKNYDRRIERITKIYNQINFDGLVYKSKFSSADDFRFITNPKELFEGTKEVKTTHRCEKSTETFWKKIGKHEESR